MSKSKTCRIRLRPGHPKQVMLARLNDDSVISIGEDGVDLPAHMVSQEMIDCKWFDGIDGLDGKIAAAVVGTEPAASTQSHQTPELTTQNGDAESKDSAKDPVTDESPESDAEPGLKTDEQPAEGRPPRQPKAAKEPKAPAAPKKAKATAAKSAAKATAKKGKGK